MGILTFSAILPYNFVLSVVLGLAYRRQKFPSSCLVFWFFLLLMFGLRAGVGCYALSGVLCSSPLS